jgi:hypothetical protein
MNLRLFIKMLLALPKLWRKKHLCFGSLFTQLGIQD